MKLFEGFRAKNEVKNLDEEFSKIRHWDTLKIFLQQMKEKSDTGVVTEKGLQGSKKFYDWSELLDQGEFAMKSETTGAMIFELMTNTAGFRDCVKRCLLEKKWQENNKRVEDEKGPDEKARIFKIEDLK